MDTSYWRKQEQDKPLFPDLLWSRPEQKSTAGKLLIVGGNLHSFKTPAEAFTEAEKAGIGTCRIIMPDSTKKIVGKIFKSIEYAPSTPSGSFSQQALAELLEAAEWADGVLIAGDLGKNSETAIAIEKFASKHSGLLTLAGDTIDIAMQSPSQFYGKHNILLVMTFSQLQKMATLYNFNEHFSSSMDLVHFIITLHLFSQAYGLGILLQWNEQLHLAMESKIITTNLSLSSGDWTTKAATYASVWWLQNPGQPLKAIATAMTEL